MNYPLPMDISSDDSFFKNTSDRIGFVRKVLGIVAFQLLITAFVTGIVISNENLMDFIQSHPEINIITAVTSLIICIVLICCKNVSRSVPQNYIFLTIFTLCESYGVAGFCSVFEASDVINAAFGAGFITFLIACFAFYSDDFEVFRFAGACFIGLFFLTIMQLLFAFGHYNVWISLGLAWYCVYLIYDLKVIMTESKYGLGMDDYIMGAMVIYIDIIVIFIRLLILIGKLKKK